MKIMFQGIQAVTVELTGVLLVVWLLFGCASWGVRTVAGERAEWNHNYSSDISPGTIQLTEVPSESVIGTNLPVLPLLKHQS